MLGLCIGTVGPFQATVFEVADQAMVAVDYAAPKGRTLSQAKEMHRSC